MTLKDKTVVITGASQGLGRTLAPKIAKLGATVVLVARSKDLLDKVKNEILSAGGKAESYVCDIRDLDQVQATALNILEKFGSIDVLINNAGVWTDNTLEADKPELRKQALETNALGHIQITNAFLPSFLEKKEGYIFNVISTAGTVGLPASDNTLWQSYGASKWAMKGFSNALKESVRGSNIKVSAFFPGGFESNLYENAGRANPHNQPWMMKAEDVADIIVFALTRPDDVLMDEIVVSKD